jgi:hypothetical protein
MRFEKQPQAPAPPEQFNLDRQKPTDIAVAVLAYLPSDARFAEVVSLMSQDAGYAAAFRAGLLERIQTLVKGQKGVYEAIFSEDEESETLIGAKPLARSGPRLEMASVIAAALEVARKLNEDFGLGQDFGDHERGPGNDFEVGPGTAPDAQEFPDEGAPLAVRSNVHLAPLAPEGLAVGSSEIVDLPPLSYRPSNFGIEQVFEPTPEPAPEIARERAFSPEEMTTIQQTLAELRKAKADPNSPLHALANFLSQDTPDSEAFRLALAMQLEREVVAHARQHGTVITPAALLERVPSAARVAAQLSGAYAIPLEKPDDGAAPEFTSGAEKYAAEVRAVAEGLMNEKYLSSWGAREARAIVDLRLLWQFPGYREQLVADVCASVYEVLRGRGLSRAELDAEIKNQIPSSILIAAEKMFNDHRPEVTARLSR